MAKVPATLQEAMIYFADPQRCHEFMVMLRWPDGKVTCPRCGSKNVEYLPNARVFKCYEKHEKQKFSLKIGTIFEESAIGLEKWLPVVWMVANCKNGISSWEIHRAMGVTQKTAWFMLQRARLALQDDYSGGKLGGPGGEIEVDESFIGGKARNMHKGKRDKKFGTSRLPGGPAAGDKAIVHGILERGKKIRANVIGSRSKEVMQGLIKKHVEPGSNVFSDALIAYVGLNSEYAHQIVDHAEAYVRGNVHTNGLENFWSLLKRSLGGTYVAVEPFHLFRYVDEQAFRYNHRELTDADRFTIAMSQAVGRRLTYAELTGKQSDAGPNPADTPEIPF